MVEHEAEALQLVRRQEPLAGFRLVAAHVAAGVRALRAKLPELGLPHHDGEHGQGPVGVAGGAAHGIEPAPHIGAGDIGDPSIFSTEGDPDGIQVGIAIATLVRKTDHASADSVGFRHLWWQAKPAELIVTAESEPGVLYDAIKPVLPLGLPWWRRRWRGLVRLAGDARPVPSVVSSRQDRPRWVPHRYRP